MKKLLLLTVCFSVLVACSGRRQAESALNSGNYDIAISKALKRLNNNKDKKRKQEFILLLEDAYQKVVECDIRTISNLKKEDNPEFYKSIYEIYLSLDSRQEAIKPVLPLQVGNRMVSFNFNDYSDDIIDYKFKVSDYLTDKALDLLDTDNKLNAREAHSILKYVDRINPNFEDVRDLMEEAHFKGTDFVIVSIENQTNQIIPKRLEDELLNFDTYGLDKFWTAYHASVDTQIDYDYQMQLQLKRINISPERIYEKEYIHEKEIVDGWKYKLDRRGNVVKDSLGNDIKVDKIVNVKCHFYEFRQSKATQVIAKVIYQNHDSKDVLDQFPIDSESIFENVYADIEGDRRALTKEDLYILEHHRPVPFPSNEQMVFDTGEDLKQKLKRIIKSYNFN